jgi:site-specific recombinase XerD
LVTEQPQYSVVVCIFSTSQNAEISLIPNGLHFIFTYPQSLALAILLHMARHTFGTTVTLANNVPLQDVSVMLGHASTRMTQHYARVMNSSLKEAMNNVKERLAQ